MGDENFYLIKDLKPYLNNISLQCLIINYIDDPPNHINNIVKYHYLIADSSGSVILCIQQNLIEEELIKNNIDIHNDDIEDVLEYNDNNFFNMNETLINKTTDDQSKFMYNMNKKPPNINMLKYFLRIGDIIKITGATTSWSMGKMVVMSSARTKNNKSLETQGHIERVGFFTMHVNLEPNVSNFITSTVEKKYQKGDNNQRIQCLKNINNQNASGNTNVGNKNIKNDSLKKKKKVSKYDILRFFNDEQMF
ncbi:conserved protein, unknown function [Hepatocystis sp. ex Piliocolobus tephrosceles]|nr:conserved protein, unknown function [Hepatocystis sp. ex Piliocolobus tephrosceles]